MPIRYIILLTISASLFAAEWNARAAADYLDSRQKQWFEWKPAAVPGGPCVSCHTGVTYLFARPVLRKALAEAQPTTYETGLYDALRARVETTQGIEIFPAFKKDPITFQSVGVESIHAALFLSQQDPGSAAAKQAFERMWSTQIREGEFKGSWNWFSLGLDPWEMPDSRFYGSVLAALAVSKAPVEYRTKDRLQDLADYLKREQTNQPLHNRLLQVWAAAGVPTFMNEPKKTIEEAWRKQQADGGWTIESLGPWKEHATAPPSVGSNSYATAVAAFTLLKAGVPVSDKRLNKAIEWLRSHQDKAGGYWHADSMNKKFDAGSMPSLFMRDAATAFAAMALLEAGQTPGSIGGGK